VVIDGRLKEKPRYGGVRGFSDSGPPPELWAMGISPQTKHSPSAQLDSTFRKLG
jgi:hypothetical protein